jgi:hypothetical protein
MVNKCITFPKLSTPHDLATSIGPWIVILFVLGPVVASICAEDWSCLADYLSYFSGVVVVQHFFSDRTIHCYTLYGKYATEGVQLQGRVVRTWYTQYGDGNDVTTNLQVSYQVDDVQYIKELQWPRKPQTLPIPGVVESFTADMVDLVHLPGYPKSALLHEFLKTVDADFPPPARDWLPMAIFVASFVFALSPIPFLLVHAYAAMLYPFWIISNVVLTFTCAYWIATVFRETTCQQMLFGAIQSHGAAPLDSSDEHVSYEKFCQLDPNHRLSYPAVLRMAVEGTLWAAYYAAFLGSYFIWYGLVVPRWKKALLERYDLENDPSFVVGSVVSKDLMDSMGVIVQYKTDDNRLYKKRLHMPVDLRQNMPNNPELVYLMGFPESAIFKESTLLDPGPAQKIMKRRIVGLIFLGLFLMAYQVGLPTWIVSLSSETSPFWVAATLLVAQCVMGFVGVWIRYQTVIEKEILSGAKQV